MKDYRKRFFYSLVGSIVAILIIIIMLIILNKIFNLSSLNLKLVINSEYKNDLKNFIEICVGIYAAVISILASQKTNLIVKISEKNYDAKFVAAISTGVIMNLLTIVFLSIFKMQKTEVIFIAISLVILSLFHFFKFLSYLIIMFSYNMSTAASENADEKEYKNDVLTEIEQMNKALKNINQSQTHKVNKN